MGAFKRGNNVSITARGQVQQVFTTLDLAFIENFMLKSG
jgi:hypothetical protein